MSLANHRTKDLAAKIIRDHEAGFGAAEADLRALVDTKDSLAELGEEQQLKMQMVMERMTKADSAASNAMKKFSETLSTIIGNFK